MRLILTLLLALIATACSSSSPAESIDFNDGWRFTLGEMDSEYYDANTNDSSWQSIRVPHDWSIELGYTQENTAGSNGFLPGGIGWYRNTFEVPKQMRGKSIFVRFEGVYNNSHVWINGHELGFYPFGYLDFEYDLTPYLNESGENIITVRVDRRAYADSRWYVGAGIYRPVHLISRGEVYIPTHGQFITTPKITEESATINVRTEFTSNSDIGKTYDIVYQIYNSESVVCYKSQSVDVPIGEVTESCIDITIPTPKLWSPTSPNRYTLCTYISVGDELIEKREESFGIRTLEFNPAKGLLINGEYTKIKGVNIHHDLGCVGVALNNDVLRRRLRKMQELGVNAVRMAHNPHSESILDMCDQMGLLVMDEFIDEWRVAKDKWIIQRSKSGLPDSLQMGYSAHFDERAEQDIKHFVRRGYNHPSVILWSIGNEIEWTYPYYWASSLDRKGYIGLEFTGNPEIDSKNTEARFAEKSGGKDELAETAHLLAKWVKEADTTRPVTAGVVIPSVARISGYTDALDVVGYNYKDTYYESHHKYYPEKLIFGSENVGQYYEWAAVADKPYIPGIFLWTGIDYMGENGPYPAKGGTYSLFDFACFKTPRGEFFETLWNDAPKTYFGTTPAEMSEFKLEGDGSFKTVFRKDPLRKWLWFELFDRWKYADGEQIVVQVYTNAPKVELLLNGKSLGIKSRGDFAEENIILWQIPYSEGELVAVGVTEDGKEHSRYSLKTSGKVTQLGLDVNKAEKCIEVTLLDANGTRVVDSDEQITITLPADSDIYIAGVDNGSDTFVGNHKTNKIVTYNGRALIVLGSDSKSQRERSTTIQLSSASGIKQSVEL